MTQGEPLAGVAVPVPLRRIFSYQVPEKLRARLRPGVRVEVPFARRRVVGTVVDWPHEAPCEAGIRLKPILRILEDLPAAPPDLLELTRFVADYYLCSWGEALEAALPPDPGPARKVTAARRAPGAGEADLPPRSPAQRRAFLRLPGDGTPVVVSGWTEADRRALSALAARGLVLLERVPEPRRRGPAVPETAMEAPLRPTEEQARVLDAVYRALDEGDYRTFLLYGATGSGKTEVYLQAAARVLESGGGVLYLVPEIGLTPLLMDRLRRRFGDSVAVLHSGLPARRRFEAWRDLAEGRRRLAVGTRSAVFAPVRGLRLVVVDEEQDTSYKQEETPRYHGRDVAVVRAKHGSAVALLGSATPSLESFHAARSGRYALLELGGRVEARPLPEVRLVDMRKEFKERGEVRPLSRTLVAELRETLTAGEQALILRNRRGWAVALYCPACGERIQCHRCSVALTWHRAERRLRCHYCNFETTHPGTCPRCLGETLREIGEGTERVEDELRAAVPDARIARMDRDTVRRRGAHETILRRFARREIDILVGTQMIAKGHDFPGITLVGVLSADQTLGLPDFRAAERTFQLLTQVEGRAGRGEQPGRVVVQAFNPGHPVLQEAARHDYEAFYRREIRYRRALRYPPLTGLVRIVVQDAREGRAREWAERLAEALREAGEGRLLLAGPGPAPVSRIRGRFRQQILARSAGRRRLVEAVRRALEQVEGEVPSRAVVVDVDPVSLL